MGFHAATSRMVIAPMGQCRSHKAQSTHFCGAVNSAFTSMSPRKAGLEMLSAPAVQKLTQIEHALHSSLSMTGFRHSARFFAVHTTPALFVTAPAGQILPHTPHSTQRLAFISCFALRSPLMANTGQECAHAVQPMHFSVIVYAIAYTFPSRKDSITRRKRAAL
jgi:hypothetical protein